MEEKRHGQSWSTTMTGRGREKRGAGGMGTRPPTQDASYVVNKDPKLRRFLTRTSRRFVGRRGIGKTPVGRDLKVLFAWRRERDGGGKRGKHAAARGKSGKGR